eukprot:CAMPEP_0185776922 /NCGR_PEP_ID=MMETSP1174-20130828/87628_1 /TAXON_ID=35687 /ORGANISM="Dictyocha speculum, Strain CCMP1381" /LENGTH=75 /DNA_ID=CAMNT_0028465099 /DNA_START=38 /DNA_END=262 /DNA_ORIENTATION=+
MSTVALEGDQDIEDVACGGAHSILLSKEGNLYSCGRAAYGRLGTGTQENCLLTPTLIKLATNSGRPLTACSVSTG